MSGVTTTALVPTGNASRYLQQLAKHWSHKLEVVFDTDSARIAFPSGALLSMATAPAALSVKLTAPDAATAQRMQGVVAQHLDRFAFREAPLAFDWSEAV